MGWAAITRHQQAGAAIITPAIARPVDAPSSVGNNSEACPEGVISLNEASGASKATPDEAIAINGSHQQCLIQQHSATYTSRFSHNY